MKLEDFISTEKIEEITNLLVQELEKQKIRYVGYTHSLFTNSESLEWLVFDIFNDYSKIPVDRVMEVMREKYPFLKNIEISPWLEFEKFTFGFSDSPIIKAYVDHYFSNQENELTPDQYEIYEWLCEELKQFCYYKGRLYIEFEESMEEVDKGELITHLKILDML